MFLFGSPTAFDEWRHDTICGIFLNKMYLQLIFDLVVLPNNLALETLVALSLASKKELIFLFLIYLPTYKPIVSYLTR